MNGTKPLLELSITKQSFFSSCTQYLVFQGDSGKNYEDEPNDLEARLPADYQSIRSNIIDTKFSCEDKEPGYYADIDNDCQVGKKLIGS